MLFNLPESISDHFTTRAMYVVQRALSASTPFIPWPQICLYLLKILNPGAPNPMQCMSFHDSGLASGPQSATSCCGLFYVLALVPLNCLPVPKFAFQCYCMLFYVPDVAICHFATHTTFVILCSRRVGIPPLIHRHNACYSMPPT